MSELNKDPPPSYDSIFGQLKKAKESSDGNVSFAKTAFGIIFGSNLGGENMSELNKDPPPSYDSIFGQLKKAKESSDGNVSFAKTAFGIIFGSIACTICLGVFLAIRIACIVIGAIYLHDCPAERYIPIYLIVAGCFSILKDLSSMIQKCTSRREEGEEQQTGDKKTNAFDGLLGCFRFAWFICGNVWIYRTYKNFSTDPLQPDYCHPTLFYFSFWLLNSTYIIIGLAIVLGCCCGNYFQNLVGVFLAIRIACIVIGAIYLHDCPAERYIPIYLIVAGCFSILKKTNAFDGLLGCFRFAWFICGNVWIYRTYKNFSTDPLQPDYCHPTLFYFSFWLLNSTYIIIGLAIVLGCCCGVFMICCSKKE